MNDLESYRDEQLPPTTSFTGEAATTLLGSIFGGSNVERRPYVLALVALSIVIIGAAIGALFTVGILSGIIDINPKAIKSIIKTLLGKS